MEKKYYLIVLYASVICSLIAFNSDRLLSIQVVRGSVLPFLIEIIKELFFGCTSTKVLKFKDLA